MMGGSTKRDLMKRKLAQALNAIDNAILDIKPVYEEFEPVHPKLAEGLQASILLMIESQNAIERFAQICWNINSETLRKYRT